MSIETTGTPRHTPRDTERLTGDAGLTRAADLLRAGALVAFPTETVYGLGADAKNDTAVAGIFAAKGRPQFNPLIVHVSSVEMARRIGQLSPLAETLAGAFWPGPLTLVVPLRDAAGISPLVTAGLDTIALRVPAAPLAAALLDRAGTPVAAPSANPSGRVSPTRADHVIDGLSGRIAAVLDGGPCDVGVESTILAVDDRVTLLRPGGLAVEEIEALIDRKLATPEDTRIIAPGQLASHYAPRAAIRLNADAARPGERFVGFGPDHPGQISLSPGGDLVEAAATLFHLLRALDAEGDAPLAIAPIPDHGLGRAINDRLRRAAAPRG